MLKLALHFCTSQGAIHTKTALETYSEERRKRIRVIGIAPAAYIPDEICHSVQNYQARWYRDPIPRIAFRSRWAQRHTIQVVPSHPTADRFDHSFSSPTFEESIQREIHNYYEITEK